MVKAGTGVKKSDDGSVDRIRQNPDGNGQKKWNDRFIGILKRDYGHIDTTISAMLSDDELSRTCGAFVRSYVDRRFTDKLYRERKDRGEQRRKQLRIAITGLNAAARLYVGSGKHQIGQHLCALALDLSREVELCNVAFATKRHGRDRAHLVIYFSRLLLESKLKRTVTYVTLANLVNAGFEADRQSPESPTTEDHIRKSLETLRQNSPTVIKLANSLQSEEAETKLS